MKGRERREGVGRREGRLEWEGVMVEGGEWGGRVGRGRGGCNLLPTQRRSCRRRRKISGL